MSMKTGIAVAACLFALVGLTGGAGAEMFAPSKAPKAAKPKVVTVTGCATKGVPEFCVQIGKYNVTGANPAVPIGKLVTVKGTDAGNPSMCSGATLDKISWKPAGGKCPKPKGAK